MISSSIRKVAIKEKVSVNKKALITTIASKEAAIKKQATRKKRAFSITAKGLVRMRKRFGMNMSQFSRLVGISPSTVKRWESNDGKLNLQIKYLQTLESLARFDKEVALETLGAVY